jgi:hypothetical protein
MVNLPGEESSLEITGADDMAVNLEWQLERWTRERLIEASTANGQIEPWTSNRKR